LACEVQPIIKSTIVRFCLDVARVMAPASDVGTLN